MQEEPQVLGVVNHVGNFLIKLAILAVFIFVLLYGTKTAYEFGYSVFTTGAAEEAPGRDVSVTILTGMSKRSIGSLLANQGVIKNATVFYVQAMIYGYDLKPGSYILNTSQSIESILLTLSAEDETQ
ncbi:MAG: endolytic transglycosylase MltG [Lachnospiraceae bacterium]|nr:endolytic transglycosylase MltG [Lachnospiraceae bacterium]